MIIVTATVWPNGNQMQSYELMHATITNKTALGDRKESYFAHVLSRPKPTAGITGYEADVEVSGHNDQDGFPPLLMSVLNAANCISENEGTILPASRRLDRVNIIEPAQFEAILRKGVR